MQRQLSAIALRPRRRLMVDGIDLADRCGEPGDAWNVWADRQPLRWPDKAASAGAKGGA